METAIALPMLVILFAIVVTAGQFIGYAVGLTDAAGTGAQAAATAAGKGASTSTAAVTAVNMEQGSSSWSACSSGTSYTAPCVYVSSSSQTTSGSTSITVESVTLHGTFTPIFNIFGVTIPLTINSTSST